MGGYFYGDVGSYTFSATYCVFFEEGICEISVFWASKTHFDHNFSKSPRINLRFCTVAKLKKLNNFYLGRFEDCPIKNSRNRDFSLYLARARARARAPGPRERVGPPALIQKGGCRSFRSAHFAFCRTYFDINLECCSFWKKSNL